MRPERLQHFPEAQRFGHRIAQERRLAVEQPVLHPEFQRMRAELLRQLIQRTLGRKARLSRSEAAVLARLWAVGVDGLSRRRPRPASGRGLRLPSPRSSGCTGLKSHTPPVFASIRMSNPSQPAVALLRRSWLRTVYGMALRSGEIGFTAGVDQHDGPVGRVRHERGGDERPRVLLAAE